MRSFLRAGSDRSSNDTLHGDVEDAWAAVALNNDCSHCLVWPFRLVRFTRADDREVGCAVAMIWSDRRAAAKGMDTTPTPKPPSAYGSTPLELSQFDLSKSWATSATLEQSRSDFLLSAWYVAIYRTVPGYLPRMNLDTRCRTRSVEPEPLRSNSG